MIKLEDVLEQSKVARLIGLKEFNFVDAFKLLDERKNEFLTHEQLSKQLKCLGLDIPPEDAHLVSSRLDVERRGVIRYSDFCQSLSPNNTA